jgi:hypothetical protein
VGIRKGGMRMNMVDIFCIHYENRMKPANIVLRSREEGKSETEGGTKYN